MQLNKNHTVMATRFNKLPKSATLIFIQARRFPESEKVIRRALLEFKESYPTSVENISLSRGSKPWHEETLQILKDTLKTKVIQDSVAENLDLTETIDATVRFVRRTSVTGGSHFFILSANKIMEVYKSILKEYDKPIPTRPVNWTETGLVVINLNTSDVATTFY